MYSKWHGQAAKSINMFLPFVSMWKGREGWSTTASDLFTHFYPLHEVASPKQIAPTHISPLDGFGTLDMSLSLSLVYVCRIVADRRSFPSCTHSSMQTTAITKKYIIWQIHFLFFSLNYFFLYFRWMCWLKDRSTASMTKILAEEKIDCIRCTPILPFAPVKCKGNSHRGEKEKERVGFQNWAVVYSA